MSRGKDVAISKSAARMKAKKEMLQDFMKAEIYTAAISAIENNNWDVVSMDQIAAEIGGSKGTIYYYFKSKNDLMADMWLHVNREMTHVLLPIYQDNTLSPYDKLEKYIRNYVGLMCQHWRINRAIWTNSLFIIKWDEDAGKKILSQRRYVVDALINMIGALSGDKKEESDLLEMKARALLHSLDSIAVWYREPYPVSVDKMADTISDIVMNGHCGRKA